MKKTIIGENVLRARREANLSQEDLARLVGVTSRTIIRLEKEGKTNLFLLERIASSVGKPVEYFIPESKHPGAVPTQGTIIGKADGWSWIRGFFKCPHCKKQILIDVNKDGQIAASKSTTVDIIQKKK